MKNKNLAISTIFIILSLLLVNCKKSTEDEFNEANDDVSEKFVKQVQIIDNVNGNKTYTLNYITNNQLTSITDGTSNLFFNFNSANDLSSIVNDGDSFNIDELYQSPYEAFKTGNVASFDNKGNPIKINVYENGYGSDILVGDIIYDPNPNPYFYTLKAANIIDVLDRADLDFGVSASPSIVKARLLLPYNNINAMIFKDQSGITKYEVHITYDYDNDKYPRTANVSVLTPDDSYTYQIIYTYK